ncbi:ABC transporter ATP-binding protein [Thauera linaloolentis]|uniref:Aliphatic sulfonates ABC transporter ATP binding protein n=1 Tax=Thauera linaloolentis (strain DSM 12138 / JCM 21573 / CCUG 41526 / CIP 105981 / IAM 15112 / NBRC 102519 / 47Lol) TaxID=1123367 RepID=N6Y3T8_THAL4|nr:ABC transporter ATP-binding protein [Thauera linaloolentis]ENO86255.1 aliphatic sulfonates ABC transporter ATP binding protein [Thauera linaloolentis 47Lol = DSM 12138]MCM8566939.1 ABC transporter ATP-binding protein [Thauera linaloolentis]
MTAAIRQFRPEEHQTQPAPAVSLRGVHKRFGTRTIIDALDLEIAPGEFVALLGRSGCGKTTLLRMLAGLDPASGGQLSVPSARAVVFQEHRLMPWKRVWRNVTLGVRTPDARRRAEQALAEVGLAERSQAWPVTLSGGEAQRVALARALVREPELLLLDEPFAALDALTRIRMHHLVQSLWSAHRPAVLLVTHDVDEALQLADRILVLDNGRFIADQAIHIPRPRTADIAEFRALRHRLLGWLGLERSADAGAASASHRTDSAGLRLAAAFD